MKNKCLGVFLAFITIPLVILSIIQLGTAKTRTSAYYKKLFQKTNAYENIVKAIPKNSDNDLNNAIYSSIDANWVKNNLEKNLDELFLFLNGKKQTANLSLDLSKVKANLPKEVDPQFAKLIPNDLSFDSYESLLNDAKSEMQKFGQSGFGTSDLNQQLEAANQQIESAKNIRSQYDSNLVSLKSGYRYFVISTYVVYGLTILLLLVIILAARHSIQAVLRWPGQTLFISGLVTFLAAFFNKKLIVAFDPIPKADLSQEFKNLLDPLYKQVLVGLSSDIGKIALIVMLSGLLLVIISYVLDLILRKPAKATLQSPVHRESPKAA